MFGAPFLLLAYRYGALPAEMPVFRNPLLHAMIFAPKSVFTVFRVPLMNLSHGLMAGVMVSRSGDFKDAERRAGYSALFSTLLFAAALKSNFEALEISRVASSFGGWVTAGTVGCVVVGVLLAFVRGRRTRLPWPELRLRTGDKIALTALFGLYLVIVTASFFIGRPA
jgi:hypothetical protein